MGKFLEAKLSLQQNVKVAKRRATNLGGKAARRARKDQSNVQPSRGSVEAEKTAVKSWPGSDYQDLRFEVGTNPTSGRKCIKLIKAEDCDLFADDDLKASYGQFAKHNLLLLIFEEIALEGLDGITIQALWKRIENVLKLEIVCQSLKDIIWQIVCSNDQVKLFELPEERQNLILPWSDPTYETNFFSDPRNTGNEIYKAELGTKDCAEWGSCSTLKDRVDVSKAARQMSVTAALTQYKNKLVLVADEVLRKAVLLEDISDPNYELMNIEYCLLERIGRARELGEMTAGAMALTTCFGLDQKSIYHYCKKLSKQSLVIRQHCFFSVNAEQTRMARLMHLRRFYRKKKSKQLIMTERAVNYLKKCTNYTAPYASVKALFNPVQLGTLFRHSEFLKFINVNEHLPYKEYYEGSTYREYMTKSLSKERSVQLAKLKDPFVNVAASWVDRQNAESSDDDDDDDDEKEKDKSSSQKARRIFNKDFIRDVYLYILSKGTTGVCVSDLNQKFDIDFPSMRAILKKLTIRQLIASRKFDVGRKTLNKFTATSLTKDQNQDVPKSIQAGSSTALEKLKQRHKQKTDSLPQSRVYSLTQFEADRRQSQALLPLTSSHPLILCEFFTLSPQKHVGSGPETNVFIVRLVQALQPFKLNVTLLKFSSLMATTKFMENSLLDSPKLKGCRSELAYSKSKPDHIMKAYLLKALMDNVKLNDNDVIQFLDPQKPTPKKRALDRASDRVEEAKPAPSIDPKVLGMFMGTSPSLILIEKDTRTGIVAEVYESNPIGHYRTGDISEYNVNTSTVSTERTLSRIAFILKTVQKDQIFEEINKFLKLIYQDESKSGYDNRIDRKSLHKICKRLTDEGYLKAFTMSVSNNGMKKSQTYLCHPQITFEHHLLQDNLQQMKEKVTCDINKTIKRPVVCKPKVPKSPFSQDDVISSLNQIKELIPVDTVKPSRASAKGYGRRPKFACLALVHELFYYLIFEENNKRPLSQADAKKVLRANQIKLTDLEMENLPPMYCKEISWKTFILPMPKHYGWEKGWGLLGDILMRFPLILITRCYSVTFYSNELQELLQHPIKRFYTLKDIPASVRILILHRRKFIYDMANHLSLLCYCGLVQMGPSSFHEKEKRFFYLNRKATLWDTTSIKSGYARIEDKDYPKIRFEFCSMEDVLKYWSTMNNICIHTHLVVKGNPGSSRSKPSLVKARSARTKANVKEFDTGDIPGDHLGAAGLDSCLWSHLPRNWHFFAPKNEGSTSPESLNSLKLDKIDTWKPSNKHYITRPRDSKHSSISAKSSKQKKAKKTIQSKPVSRRNIQKAAKRLSFDAVDRAVVRKFGGLRYRPRWSQEEDKLLILFKIAISFLTPGTINNRIGYAVLRDLLNIRSAKSRDKTSRNVSNRYKLLNKNVRFLSNLENLIPNLYKLTLIGKYFVPLKNFLLHGVDTSGLNRKFKISDQELRVAFIFLAYYILNHQREVEVALHGKLTSTDYFNKENFDFYAAQIVPCGKVKRFYVPPTSEEDIVKGTLKGTIQCSLSHKSTTPDWSEQTYKVYQQFTQELLQSTLNDMKNQRMIQFKKEHRKSFFTPYRLSLHFVLAQSATFSYQTMDEAFAAFLGLQSHQSSFGSVQEAVEESKYGHMLGLNEVLSFNPWATTMEFNFPEHHFALNPHLDDHSEVIEELAKRYQAKLKSELKDVNEATVESSEKPEEDEGEDGDTEMGEPAPDSSGVQPMIEVTSFDEGGEPLDLSITANDSATIDHLKHWISDCIDLDRVRSPSPELFNLSIKQEEEVGEKGMEQSPDKILSLSEIKEEMLKPFDCQEKRLVPHISDLTKLLSTTFDEITDDRANYLMKKHFVQQYPTLESFKADGLEPLAQALEHQISIKAKMERAAHIGLPTDRPDFEDVLLTNGIVKDVKVAWDVLDYIEAANVYGATGFDLKEAFPNEPIAPILNAFTEHHFVLRTGICDVTFVHFKYQSPWLTNTFRICRDQEDPNVMPISASLSNWFKVKALPWTTIDGSMDPDMLKMWLSQVFSYCIENPKIPMRRLCNKFCYLKPVDVFYLVEVLEEINALEIRQLKKHETHLFSEYTEVEDCKGSFLDRFEDLYIDCKNIGFITVGSWFHSLK